MISQCHTIPYIPLTKEQLHLNTWSTSIQPFFTNYSIPKLIIKIGLISLTIKILTLEMAKFISLTEVYSKLAKISYQIGPTYWTITLIVIGLTWNSPPSNSNANLLFLTLRIRSVSKIHKTMNYNCNRSGVVKTIFKQQPMNSSNIRRRFIQSRGGV